MAQETYGTQAPSNSLPQQRIIQKLDEHMSRRDYAGAERHLLYWLEEALAIGDKRGELMVRNELVGHFRKTGNQEQAFLHAGEALKLVDELGFGNTISAGTTYTNAATAFNAFDENKQALELFEKATALYESSPHTTAPLLGGLYNNRALTCVALGMFDEADTLYQRALAVMETAENGALEQAITYLNMADAVVARAKAETRNAKRADNAHEANRLEKAGWTSEAPHSEEASSATASYDAIPVDAACEEEVNRLLDKAYELFDTPSVPHDGYYAFVCEKCAPTFAYYGYFLADADLRERARAIYERR